MTDLDPPNSRVLLLPRDARKRFGKPLFYAVLAEMNAMDWPEDSEMPLSWFENMRRAVDTYKSWSGK